MNEFNKQIIVLPVPVPPMLEETCGYTGNARYVALYWGSGDEVYLDDGQLHTTGDRDAYRTFVQHWSAAPVLQRFDLRSSKEEVMHWLILDRALRRLSIATALVAQNLLQTQWKSAIWEQLEIISFEDMELLIQVLIAQMKAIDNEQIRALVREQQQRVAKMQMWLDGTCN